MTKINTGIRTRLFAGAVFMIIVVTFTLGFIGLRITGGFMHKKFSDRIQFLARYLALNAEVGVLIGDKGGLKNLAMNLLGEEDVASVTIYDNQKNRLVDLTRKIKGPYAKTQMPVVFKKAVEENILYQTPFATVDIAKSDSSDFIGMVEIKYSTAGIEALMLQITGKFVIASMVMSLVAVILFYLISRPIINEVMGLASTSRQIASGNQLLRASPGFITEIRDLSVSFNSMLDSLDRSREALNRANRKIMRQRLLAETGKFSLMVAHEFKNPLGIIKSSLDILKKDYAMTSENVLVHYMEDEIKRLNTLIEDFLVFARPVDPVLRETDPNQIVSDICDRFELLYPGSNVNFETDLTGNNALTMADPDLLSRCIANIVKNACEAAGENGVASISTGIEENYWLLKVKDSGDGIPQSDINRIFKPFFTTKSKGTGLGLAFVSQVAESHNGYVEACNGVTGGAVFTLRVPLAGFLENPEINENLAD